MTITGHFRDFHTQHDTGIELVHLKNDGLKQRFHRHDSKVSFECLFSIPIYFISNGKERFSGSHS
jgi:hypothetical protein